jgi:hypothetical protein
VNPRSRSFSVFLSDTARSGHPRPRTRGLRVRGYQGPNRWLVAAALGLLWFHCWQAITANAQVPGVVSTGGIYAGSSQSPGSPPPAPFGTRRREVFDPNALAHIKSFCVDLRNLEGWQADGVRDFLARESQPKKLLSHLPWQFIDDCTKADAVARIYFAPDNIEDVAREYSLNSPPGFQQGYRGRDRARGQNTCCQHQNNGIVALDAVKQACHQPSAGERNRNSYRKSDAHLPERAAQNEPKDVPAIRAQRHA